MTCTYDFRWRHIYVKSPILSVSNILGPQGPIISFPHNFTKNIFFKSSTCYRFRLVRSFQRANKKVSICVKMCYNQLGMWRPSIASGQLYLLIYKRSNIKYDQLPAKVAEEIPWNKILVYEMDHTDFKTPHICYRKKENKQL